MNNNLNDLRIFIVVVKTQSFTKAGAKLGISQSAVSHAMRGLEERLKIKLLQRTTRSIATTPAGEQLYQRLLPLFNEIDTQLDELSQYRHTLKGKLRINASDHAFVFVLQDKFLQFMQAYPEVELELISETRFTDIVAERYDAGIRLGDDVAKDMIAVRISDDMHMATVASSDYLAKFGTPNTPYDLTEHICLRFRLPTSGGVMPWEFLDPNTGKITKVQPQGRFTTNSRDLLKRYAVQGLGILWTPLDSVQDEIASGALVKVLDAWDMFYAGYYLYYPNRRLDSPLFQALIQCLKV